MIYPMKNGFWGIFLSIFDKMNHRRFLHFLFLPLLLLPLLALPAFAQTVAVLPFHETNAAAEAASYGEVVASMFGTHLRSETNFKVTDSASAEALLSGDIAVLGAQIQIDARLVTAKTGDVVVSEYAQVNSPQELRPAVSRLAKTIEDKYLRQWMGSLQITAIPVEGEVYLNGAFQGKASSAAPLKLSNIFEGEYNLKVMAGGYQTSEQSIQVQPRTLREVQVALQSLPGSLDIASEPSGAEVLIGGQKMGKTPFHLDSIAEGVYAFSLSLPNYKPHAQRLRIQSGQLTEIKAKLEVVAGQVYVTSVPSGAQVFVSKALVGATPVLLDNVPPGAVQVDLKLKGYAPWQQFVTVHPGAKAEVSPTLIRETGKLTLVSAQDSVSVVVRPQDSDSVLWSKLLPLHKEVLDAGDYSVSLSKNKYYSKTYEVRVLPDQETRIEAELQIKPAVVRFTQESDTPVDVYIDGDYLGKAKGLVAELPQGKHEMLLRNWFAEKKLPLTLAPDQEVKLSTKEIATGEGTPWWKNSHSRAGSSPSYYGFSGYNFVPDGFVSSGWKYSGFIGGEYTTLKNVRLYPKYLGFRGVFFDERLELSLSSAYGMVDSNGFSPRRVAKGLAPVVPALKWNFAEQGGRFVHWGWSVGVGAPYGVYAALSTQLKAPVVQPDFTVAMSLHWEYAYGMFGVRLRAADLSGKPLPFALTAEGAWASSVEQLGTTLEEFFALGASVDLGRNITLLGSYRVDPNTKNAPNPNDVGKWALRLEYHFSGIKSAKEGI
jgi:TolB-like protein